MLRLLLAVFSTLQLTESFSIGRLPQQLVAALSSLVDARMQEGASLGVSSNKVPKPKGQKATGQLILIRHGESVLNEKDTFSGWIDADVTENGKKEMEHAGRLMLERGYTDVDVVYTSRLKRSIRSAWTLLKELNSIYRPLQNSWRLNQRHFGAFEGVPKAILESEIGEDKVQEYRNSLYARPPPMTPDHPHWHQSESKYADLSTDEIPTSESIYDCMMRTVPFYEDTIVPELKAGKTVMIVAHANSLRGVIKRIDNLTPEQVQDVALPNGIPLVYKFDADMKPIIPAERQGALSAAFLETPKALKVLLEKEKSWGKRDQSAQVYKGLYSIIDYESSNLKHPATTLPLMQGLFVLEQERAMLENFNPTRSIADGMRAAVATTSASTDTATTIPLAPASSSYDDEYESEIGDQYVVFIRHGQTEYNKLGIFTGWDDAPLAKEGRDQAHAAGQLLKKHGMSFDIVYTSWLSRAIETAWAVVDELDQLWLPLIKSWRLNERMYGQLTGMSKKGIAETYGDDQLKAWRRGYAIQPPPVNSFSFNYPGNDDRYSKYVTDLRVSLTESIMRSISKGKLEVHRKFPKTESLRDCMSRTIPFYTGEIIPQSIAKGKRVLIASSENAIRGLLMHLCDIPPDRISEIDIPNGLPLVFNLKKKCIQILDDGNETDEDFSNPLRRYKFGESPELLFKPCDFDSDEGAATECFIGENGRSYAWDPIIRLKKKKGK